MLVLVKRNACVGGPSHWEPILTASGNTTGGSNVKGFVF